MEAFNPFRILPPDREHDCELYYMRETYKFWIQRYEGYNTADIIYTSSAFYSHHVASELIIRENKISFRHDPDMRFCIWENENGTMKFKKVINEYIDKLVDEILLGQEPI